MKNNINIRNKKAEFEFSFIEFLTAGIVLFGSEVKSIRNGAASFTDAYCYIKDGEIFLKNLHISEYKDTSYNQHEPKRERKLLLTKKEIRKLKTSVSEKGLTIIPTKMFISEKGLVKIVIALAKGKKLWDKRADLKSKDAKREIGENY